MRCDDLTCAKYLIDNYSMKTMAMDAAQVGNLEILKYIYHNTPLNLKVCQTAAHYGHLDCLRYAHEVARVPLYTSVLETAAQYGHLDCLKYIYENERRYVPFTRLTILAAENGHLDCLKYIYENSVALPPMMVVEAAEGAAKNGHLDCLKYLSRWPWPFSWEQILNIAAQNGQLDCLKYLRQNGGHVTKLTLRLAESNPECWKYLWENGCSPFNDCAIHSSGLECLKHRRSKGGRFDEMMTINAVKNGDIESLKYLREIRCPESPDLCYIAARTGNLTILKHLHQNGYVWNGSAMVGAAKGKSVVCLKYAHENDCCYITNRLLRLVWRMKDPECMEYMRQKGYTWVNR
jgi:hypothetical protein